MIVLLQINYEMLAIFSSLIGGGALGGLVSTIINRKENRRIKKSEAVKSEAEAKKEDVSAAVEMMGLLERTVSHMERMNDYNKTNSEELLKLLRDKDGINEKLRNDIKLLQLQRTEDHRRITGLEKAFDREFEWRKDSDYHYCRVKDCDKRQPPLGTFKREPPPTKITAMNTQLFLREINTNLFSNRMSNSQRAGIIVKLTEFGNHRITDIRWSAYMLATSFHETARTMRPVEEIGKGRGKPYGQKLKYNRKLYTWPDKIYYGRGDVQLTWYENYQNMGRILNLPLLEQPELALQPTISARIMIEGMTKGISNRGDFTGVSLENYFNSYTDDPIRARRIVNGLDQANRIAEYHYKFLDAIKKAS